MQIIDYDIIEARTTLAVKQQVKAKMEAGHASVQSQWQPIGGVVPAMVNNNAGFIQAMVLVQL